MSILLSSISIVTLGVSVVTLNPPGCLLASSIAVYAMSGELDA